MREGHHASRAVIQPSEGSTESSRRERAWNRRLTKRIAVRTRPKMCYSGEALSPKMVGVAQLVRAPGCGPGGRGFKSHRSPFFSAGAGAQC